MSRNKAFRQFHRWTATVFMISVVVTAVALSLPDPIIWISYIPLLPLLLLMITGSYLLVLPWRKAARS